MAKVFLILGSLLVLIGLLMLYKVKFTWIGKLPGDLSFHFGNTHLYIPITTSVIVSVIFSLIFFLCKK